MLKYLYIALGLISLTLGLLGIVTPGLPTTPFLLLTAFLFAKGSPRLHQKLLEHKLTGRYIKRVNAGLSLKARLISIGVMWVMICFTAFVVFDYGRMRFIMISLGLIGTVAQLLVFRKYKSKPQAVLAEIESNNEEVLDNRYQE